jgi:membrane protein DedA with SNARE-associated domain
MARLVAQYGLFVLLVVFALEGALVGKLIPTRASFVAAVLTVGAVSVGALAVVATAVVGATLGQVVLFGLVRYADVAPGGLPGSDPERGRFAAWFDRWGLSAVALSNALPLTRGSLTVPAAMAEEMPVRFSASSLVGTAVYACGLVAVAAGVDYLAALV